ncbi:MAG: ORF6N domain-containing protein [bacterium]
MKEENLINQIYFIRNEKVILDYDLASLYEINTKVLKQAVKRNMKRFPTDFMFELSKTEFDSLRSQIVTSNRGGSRYMPFAFTEQGVAMLSGVLHSDKAIEVNIAIMRTFVQLRQFAFLHKELFDRMKSLESNFESLKDLVLKLLIQEEKPKRRIGFTTNGN